MWTAELNIKTLNNPNSRLDFWFSDVPLRLSYLQQPSPLHSITTLVPQQKTFLLNTYIQPYTGKNSVDILGFKFFLFTRVLIVSIVNHIMMHINKVIYFIFCNTGEYLALTGDKLNGVEMIACNLATHYSLNAVCSSLLLFVLVILFTVCWSVFHFLHDLASPWRGLLGLKNASVNWSQTIHLL